MAAAQRTGQQLLPSIGQPQVLLAATIVVILKRLNADATDTTFFKQLFLGGVVWFLLSAHNSTTTFLAQLTEDNETDAWAQIRLLLRLSLSRGLSITRLCVQSQSIYFRGYNRGVRAVALSQRMHACGHDPDAQDSLFLELSSL